MLILQKLKSQDQHKLEGVVCVGKHLRKWTKTSTSSASKQQINDSKHSTTSWYAAQCSVFQTCSFLFSTEDDPVRFARTLVNVMVRLIHHFQCNQSDIAAVITLSTDLFHATSNIFLPLNCLHLFLDEAFWFFRNSEPSDVSFFEEATSNFSIVHYWFPRITINTLVC